MIVSESADSLNIPEGMRKYSLKDLKFSSTVLGKGGFAKVKRAQLTVGPDSVLDVAVKIIDKSQFSRTAFSNMQNEVNICSRLSHPCIINTHGIIEDENMIYIIMDLAEGGELFKYTKKFGLEDMPIVAPKFIGEVVLGLEYMLSQRVLHRDIKPENLLLTSEYHVKISDFGTACVMDDVESNKFAGTALYLSPEVIATGHASPTSDVWALGCVLYQLFVGRAPFEGVSEYLIIQAIKEKRFQFPPYFPKDARNLVEAMLVDDPSERVGARGYTEIKAHPFFKDVDWTNILTRSNVTYLNANFSALWERFLLQGESVVYSSLVTKERYKALSVKERILILTDFPRLFYLEPESQSIKGQVPWTDEMCAQADSQCQFHVYTPDRTYHFIDKDQRAAIWAAKINDQVKKKQVKQ